MAQSAMKSAIGVPLYWESGANPTNEWQTWFSTFKMAVMAKENMHVDQLLRLDNRNVAFFLTLFVLEMTEITNDRSDFKKTVHRIGRSGGTFITNPQYILAFLRCPIDVSLFPFDQQFCNITVKDGQSVIKVKYKRFGFHQGEFLFCNSFIGQS